MVDGIAFGPIGPVLVHVYDPPAGGMWIDDVIPGKLGALERHSGETIWVSPCEVGYGRGFGAGLGNEQDVIVLGPSSNGPRIVRMALGNGKLLGAAEIELFDEAIVASDLCICVAPNRVFALMSDAMIESWEYSREGERYHHLARSGNHIYVVFTNSANRKQGVLCLDAETGEFQSVVAAPSLPVIHDIAVNSDGLILLTRDLHSGLPAEMASQFMSDLARRGEDAMRDTLSLLALTLDSQPGDAPLWYEILSTQPAEEVPEVSITADNGKLHLIQGAHLQVRDTLTGRCLGDWAIPGLDERVAWEVCDGAGLLAEETRLSIFELPA